MSAKKNTSSKQYTQEEYLRRKARIQYGIIALVVLAAAAIGIFVWRATRTHPGAIDGTYYCQLTDDSAYVFYLDFDSKTGTYSSKIDDEDSGSGTYQVSDSKLITSDEDGSQTTYDIQGNYLLDTGSYCEGEIPEGETFNATLLQTIDSYTVIIDFNSDGTYTSSVMDDSEEEPIVTTGTYVRDGDFLYRSRIEDDGSESSVPTLLVLNGQANSYYYQKAPTEDGK